MFFLNAGVYHQEVGGGLKKTKNPTTSAMFMVFEIPFSLQSEHGNFPNFSYA